MKQISRLIGRLLNLVNREDGSTLAEMAIMVPFLAIMLAGVSEFGRYFQAYTTLAKSTRSASRYLSNHPFNATEQGKAVNLAVCGKLTCAGGDELLPGLSSANVCIESTGVAPVPTTVTVRIPDVGDGCAEAYIYQPVFDLGALLHTPSFSMAKPIRPSNTMYFMLDN